MRPIQCCVFQMTSFQSFLFFNSCNRYMMSRLSASFIEPDARGTVAITPDCENFLKSASIKSPETQNSWKTRFKLLGLLYNGNGGNWPLEICKLDFNRLYFQDRRNLICASWVQCKECIWFMMLRNALWPKDQNNVFAQESFRLCRIIANFPTFILISEVSDMCITIVLTMFVGKWGKLFALQAAIQLLTMPFFCFAQLK